MFGDPIENDKGWEVKKLGEICDVRDGTHDSPKYQLEGFPLITSKNIVSGKISFDNVNLISKEDFDAINKRSKVDFGDILMPMIGTIGNPVINDTNKEFAIKNVALIKCTNSKEKLNLYIKYTLDSPSFKEEYSKLILGGTQKFLSLGIIRNLEIPISPFSLQFQFAQRIEKIETQKELVKQSIAQTEQLINYTMDKYFG
ncbi:MAG: restriction endonuclease subunit S [Oscillospiraceae bacterium]|nr:restriction endonuclease subunit S [Oscillospiraceae bacterium]